MEIREISGFCRDLVRFFRTSKRVMLLEGQRRWLDVGEVSRVVDLEKRSVKYQDSVGNWSDFSGLPRVYAFRRSLKVVGGRRCLKGSRF